MWINKEKLHKLIDERVGIAIRQYGYKVRTEFRDMLENEYNIHLNSESYFIEKIVESINKKQLNVTVIKNT